MGEGKARAGSRSLKSRTTSGAIREQLAEALQRVVEEAAERAAGVRAANTPLRLAEAGEMLGYKPSFVLRLDRGLHFTHEAR